MTVRSLQLFLAFLYSCQSVAHTSFHCEGITEEEIIGFLGTNGPEINKYFINSKQPEPVFDPASVEAFSDVPEALRAGFFRRDFLEIFHDPERVIFVVECLVQRYAGGGEDARWCGLILDSNEVRCATLSLITEEASDIKDQSSDQNNLE